MNQEVLQIKSIWAFMYVIFTLLVVLEPGRNLHCARLLKYIKITQKIKSLWAFMYVIFTLLVVLESGRNLHCARLLKY